MHHQAGEVECLRGRGKRTGHVLGRGEQLISRQTLGECAHDVSRRRVLANEREDFGRSLFGRCGGTRCGGIRCRRILGHQVLCGKVLGSVRVCGRHVRRLPARGIASGGFLADVKSLRGGSLRPERPIVRCNACGRTARRARCGTKPARIRLARHS